MTKHLIKHTLSAVILCKSWLSQCHKATGEVLFFFGLANGRLQGTEVEGQHSQNIPQLLLPSFLVLSLKCQTNALQKSQIPETNTVFR